MPVPATIDDLSTTAGSNSPTGGETPKDGDNYLRSLSSFIALLRDKLDGTSNTGTITNATFSGTTSGLRVPLVAYKTATTSRASTVTVTDDPHLVIALTAGTWAIDGYCGLAEDAIGANGGFKATVAFSGTSTGRWAATGSASGSVLAGQSTAIGTNATLVNTSMNPVSSPLDWFRLSGYITVTVAGNVSLKWAQDTSDANGTNVMIGSWIACTQVS